MTGLLADEIVSWPPLIIIAIASAIAAIGGIFPLIVKSTRVAVVAEFVSHFVAIKTSFLALYYMIPRYKVMFEDLGVELAGATIAVFNLSDLTINYGIFLLPLMLVLLIAESVVFLSLHAEDETRAKAKFLSVGLTAGFVVFITATCWPVAMTLIALINALS